MVTIAPAHAIAQARPAQCLLEVKGAHHIGGPCAYTPLDRLGSFRITDTQGLNLIAQVNAYKKDGAKALWNGPLEGNASGEGLGDAYRSGCCWTLSDSSSDNYDDSRICAWELTEQVHLGPSPPKPDPTSTAY